MGEFRRKKNNYGRLDQELNNFKNVNKLQKIIRGVVKNQFTSCEINGVNIQKILIRRQGYLQTSLEKITCHRITKPMPACMNGIPSEFWKVAVNKSGIFVWLGENIKC